MLEGETDFKKMYRDHVQEHIDLKKHVNSLEAAKMKKLHEMSQSQNSFLRKYNKYMDGSLHPSKRKTTGLQSPRPIDGLQPTAGRRKSLSDVSITKNLGLSMPVDSPYSLQSWHTLVNNGCRDTAGRDPIELLREQLVREPVPEMSSLEEENLRIAVTPNKVKQTNVSVKRRLSRDMTSLDISSLDQNKIVKRQLSRRSSLDLSNHSPLLRREKTDVPKSCLNTSPPTERKPHNKHVTLIIGADTPEQTLTMETTKVKLPMIGSARRSESDSEGVFNDEPPSTPAAWSGLTTKVRRGRSNSLAPGMLQSFQSSKSLNKNSPIMEQDETTLMKKVRSNSSGEIEKIRDKLSTTIKETATMEKAALQIMMENSKGINKFKYLTKMVNVGLKQMKDVNKENIKQEKTFLDEDIVACRYLRMPRASIVGEASEADMP